MTDNNHPINPPPELVQQWIQEASGQPPGPDARVIATLAARWGAALAKPEPEGPTDEDLFSLDQLRDKWNAQADAFNTWDELGIDEIVWWAQHQALAHWGNHIDPDGIIRRALESLPN